MKCPECQKQGLKSIVYEGPIMSTASYSPPFYDEDGVRHDHDGNITTFSYSCSNGHRWSKRMGKSCPAPGCDWSNE